MFNLWGDFGNFNYAKHDDIECSGFPSAIDEWSDYDGIYCPAADDNQLWKNTWHGGWAKEKLNWAPASKITRFESGICGITTDGKLFILWNEGGTIRSVPLDLPSIHGVRAVGWGSAVLLTNGNDELYTVLWDGSWKEKEITIDKPKPTYAEMSVIFGNHNGELYMLYGWYDHFSTQDQQGCDYCLHEVYLYHMKFVGGSQRYQAIRIQGDTNV